MELSKKELKDIYKLAQKYKFDDFVQFMNIHQEQDSKDTISEDAGMFMITEDGPENIEQEPPKEVKWLESEFKKVQLGEDADGNPYYLGQDSNPELQKCIDIAVKYASQFTTQRQEELSVNEIKDEGIKYLEAKYPDKKILQLPDITEGGEFVDFAMGMQIGHDLALKQKQVTDEEIEKTIKEQDSMIGQLTRHTKYLEDTDFRYKQWIRQAKQDAGYDDSISFDIVWADALKAMRDNKIEI